MTVKKKECSFIVFYSLSFSCRLPLDDIFAHAALKLKCPFLTCPRRYGISPEVVGIWSFGCCTGWEIISTKWVMGCISKQREVGGTGRFEGSILLPKWNFWHDPGVLEFPFLFYSQDWGKEWLHMTRASHHHFLVLPCSVMCCKWSLISHEASESGKRAQWLFWFFWTSSMTSW